jgi:hypothetical protein
MWTTICRQTVEFHVRDQYAPTRIAIAERMRLKWTKSPASTKEAATIAEARQDREDADPRVEDLDDMDVMGQPEFHQPQRQQQNL